MKSLAYPMLAACLIPLMGPMRVRAQQTSATVADAAKQAFDRGTAELARGNHTGAVTLLDTAARLDPNIALYHHRLGKACLEAESYAKMWTHLHKAAFLDHANEEFARDFFNMWMYHDRQAIFNVGTSADTVLKALGDPDARRPGRMIYGFMAIDFDEHGVRQVVDLRGDNDEATEEVETAKIPIDLSSWNLAHHVVSRRDDNREYTREGEQVQSWTEMLSTQRFPMLANTSASVTGMVDSMHHNLLKTDPDVVFEIIDRSPDSITYHWRIGTSKQQTAQHEIAKILKGKRDFYRIAYVKKTEKLTDSEFDQWRSAITETKLVPAISKADGAAARINFSSWELGKHLAFAALVRGQHGPEDAVKVSLRNVSKHAQILNVDVPAPEVLSGDRTKDLAAAIGFLLNKAGKPIYNNLQDRHGDTAPALFELGTKSTLLVLMYGPQDSTSQALAAAIERSASKAGVESSTWQPLVNTIQQNRSVTEVQAELKAFQKRISDELSH